MKSTTLELFWVEKIKLTQNTINITKQLQDKQLDYANESSNTSIRKVLETMVGHDKKFTTYLPFAIKFGQFLRLPKANQIEIEKELAMVRDNFNPPALPPHLSDIIARSASELDYSSCNPSLSNLFQSWQDCSKNQESRLEFISEEESYSIRYFTLTGIYILPSAINMIAMWNHKLLKDGICKQMNDSNFPK
jgi:hypothetical protein